MKACISFTCFSVVCCILLFYLSLPRPTVVPDTIMLNDWMSVCMPFFFFLCKHFFPGDTNFSGERNLNCFHWWVKNNQGLDKDSKPIQWTKNSLFNKWFWDNWVSTCQRIKLNPYLTLHTKINSKWITDLNVRAKTIKLLEENIEEKLHDIGFSNY